MSGTQTPQQAAAEAAAVGQDPTQAANATARKLWQVEDAEDIEPDAELSEDGALCSGDSTCSSSSFFCNFDDVVSGTCEACPEAADVCYELGLHAAGVTDCERACSRRHSLPTFPPSICHGTNRGGRLHRQWEARDLGHLGEPRRGSFGITVII